MLKSFISPPVEAPGATPAPVVGERMRQLVKSVLDVVPLSDALDVFSERVQGENDASAMLDVAALRGERAKRVVEFRSGVSNSTEEAGERLSKTAETVRNWVEQGRLVAYRAVGDRGKIRLPVWQFDEAGNVRSWVAPLIEAFGGNGWDLVDFVTTPREPLGGAPYLHGLLRGRDSDIEEVIAAARRANPD